MSDNYSVGIDPGLTGAISLLQDNKLIEIWDMPSISASKGKGNIVSPQLVAGIFSEIVLIISGFDMTGNSQEYLKVTLEQVSARPKQGVSSMFKFGRCFGVVEGVVAALGLPIQYVTPQKWKKIHGLTGKDKDAARQLCLQMFPEKADYFKRKKDCDRADAVLIGMMDSF